MTTEDPWKHGFARFLDAADPYLDEIVVAGGWASRLHRLAPAANVPSFEPLVTKDVDAATPSTMGIRDKPLDERLNEADFKEEVSSDFNPPITRYTLAEPEGFEIEFLTDQPGGHVKRDDGIDATANVAGVTAQKLHYIRLLLESPWTVKVRSDDGYPMPVDVRTVRIPNPASYIVQKLLVRKHRDNYKGAKDVLYIHDTLDLFGAEEELIQKEWTDLRSRMPAKWVSRARERAKKLAAATCADVINAARIANDAGRSTDPQRIAAVIRLGLTFLA